MRAIRAIAGLVLMAGVMTTAWAVLVQGPAPFMQRVEPVDFLALEAKNDVSYSASAELVLYRTAEGRIVEALILTRKGDGYALGKLDAVNGCVSGDVKPRESAIPASIAGRVIESIKSLMEYQVLAPAEKQEDVNSPSSPNCWIWLRTAPAQMITGMVPGYTMHSPRGERAQTFQLLVHVLDDIAEADEDAQNRHLTDLDLITGRFLVEEESKHTR